MTDKRPLVVTSQGAMREIAAGDSLPADIIVPSLDPWLGMVAVDAAPTSDAAFNLARTYYARATRGPRMTISKLGLYVATSVGNVALAVHRTAGAGTSAAPGEQVATTGTITCPPANAYTEVSLSVSITVAPGDWFALATDATTARFGALVIAGFAMNSPLAQQGAGMCPATPSSLATTIRRPLLFGVA